MATTTIITTFSDLSGEEGADSVRFGLDGVTYEVDLSPEEAHAFREHLDRYITAGRRIGGRRQAKVRRTT